MNLYWDRKEVKRWGKEAFRNNFWRCVLVAAILALLGVNINFSWKMETKKGDNGATQLVMPWENYVDENGDFHLIGESAQSAMNSVENVAISITGGAIALVVSIVIAIIVFIISVIALLVRIFLINPLEVGGARFFLENSIDEKASPRYLLSGFDQASYVTVVKTLFFRHLFTFLWSLLFVIPGIVKAYEYRMIPYLLANNPTMDRREAFARSKEMMDGNKMNVFIYDLSFIGWYILSGITGGIVGIFYSNPYKLCSDMQLYLAISGERFGGDVTQTYSQDNGNVF